MPANRLRELREEMGISAAELGRRLAPAVDGSTVTRWETQVSGIPDWRKQQLAELLGVSVPFLMGWDQPNGNDNGEAKAA